MYQVHIHYKSVGILTFERSVQINWSVLIQGQIQEQLAEQKARENEVSNFIKASRVMQQRVTKDIQALKEHWKKYGYQAPQDTQRKTGK